MLRVFIAVLCFMSIATIAQAQNTWQDWGKVGWWTIGWNTDDEGCAFFATYVNNMSLRLNVHEDDLGDFVLLLPGKVLKNGVKYKVDIIFDGRRGRDSWQADVVANVTSDENITVTSLASTASLEFLQSVSRGRNITVYANKKQIAQLLLDGSQSAFAQALQCKDLRIAKGDKQYSKTDQTPSPPQTSTGTGFIVSEGNVVTANHIVKGCQQSIKMLQGNGAVSTKGLVLRRDDAGDLAVIHAEDLQVKTNVEFRIAPAIRAGESVAVFGYPLSGMLSSTGNIVAGYITSLAGTGDDASKMQISAPIAPGDSGAAVLDSSGNVIGMVVSLLLPSESYTPQNINFATKASAITTFLDANSVKYSLATPVNQQLQLPELADLAKVFTVAIECQ